MSEIDDLLDLDGFLYNDHVVLNDEEAELRAELQALIHSPGDLERRSSDLHFLLGLMHEGREKDEPSYLSDVYLPWVAVTKRTRDHSARIRRALASAAVETDPRARTAELVRVYRDLVGDLFDPYVTIVVATYQFLDGTFGGIEQANLGAGERQKVEYAVSRARRACAGHDLFMDYDPVVRNAVSHAGSHGYEVGDDGVLFRSIKRGDPPTVETVRWSHDETLGHTVGLFETIRSIEIAANVFGFDCVPTLLSNFEGLSAMMNYAFDSEQRAALRATYEASVDALRTNADLPPEERLRRLTDVFRRNCDVRGMALLRVRVDDSRSDEGLTALVVDVPEGGPDGRTHTSGDADLSTAISLVRYAVVGRAVYGALFDPYVVRGIGADGSTPRVVTALPGSLIDAYSDEEAGLLDLLNDGTFWIDGERARIEVDFEDVARREEMDLGAQRLPRKPR